MLLITDQSQGDGVQLSSTSCFSLFLWFLSSYGLLHSFFVLPGGSSHTNAASAAAVYSNNPAVRREKLYCNCKDQRNFQVLLGGLEQTCGHPELWVGRRCMPNYTPCVQLSLTAALKCGFYGPSPTQSVMAVWVEPLPVVCHGPAGTVMSERYASALASYRRIKEVLRRKRPTSV